jgi:predicted nucleotidyltransferase
MDHVDQIVERAADRLRELEPDAIAVVVTGSYARGAADEHSDLDVRAITKREPRPLPDLVRGTAGTEAAPRLARRAFACLLARRETGARVVDARLSDRLPRGVRLGHP